MANDNYYFQKRPFILFQGGELHPKLNKIQALKRAYKTFLFLKETRDRPIHISQILEVFFHLLLANKFINSPIH